MAGQAARQSDRDISERAGEFARVKEWELNRRRLIRLAYTSLGEIGGRMALISNSQSFAGFEHHSLADTRQIWRPFPVRYRSTMPKGPARDAIFALRTGLPWDLESPASKDTFGPCSGPGQPCSEDYREP